MDPVRSDSTMPVEEAWCAFFDHPDYVRFSQAVQGPERTADEIEALARMLDLSSGVRVLDLGCGYGRLSVPLATRGCLVTGLDSSERLLEVAGARAAAAGVEVTFWHRDMRDLDAAASFDVVLNTGTAFGYVADESAHDAALVAARRALVAGGRILIDTENREAALRRPQRVWFDFGGTRVWCDRSLDLRTGRWSESITWQHGAECGSARYTVRLYTLAELARMLETAGFEVENVWGDFAGRRYEADSKRMIVRARKHDRS